MSKHEALHDTAAECLFWGGLLGYARRVSRMSEYALARRAESREFCEAGAKVVPLSVIYGWAFDRPMSLNFSMRPRQQGVR